jgi:protein transport protein SEC61 subunit alpha
VLATAIALGEAAAHVLLGAYGPVGELNGALIVLQLLPATAVVVFLDDLFDKGYGLLGSSAVALLSATNNCGKVFWQAFSPVTVNTGRGPEFEGIVRAVVYQGVARAGNARALAGTLLRRHLPNAMGLLATCLVLLAAVFLEGVQMPLQSRDVRGRRATFPIKLLYTSTMPIVLHSAAVTALYLVSQLLHYSRFGGGALARLPGVWKEASHAAVPVGVLAYCLTPPSSAAADPLHALVYAVLLLASCAVLSKARAWVALIVVTGSSLPYGGKSV